MFIIGNVDLGNGGAVDMTGDNDQDATAATTTEEEIPEASTKVPEDATATQAKQEVSVEGQQGQETGSKIGVYSVTASENGFSPSRLVVSRGDTVQLEFTAEGQKLDFSIPYYNFHISAEAGATSQSSFGASAEGTYRIECRDFCPDSGKIVGEFIVRPQE